MPFDRPTLTELIARAQGDIESRLPGADSRLRRNTIDVLARTHAGALNGAYGMLDEISRFLPDVAETDRLERWAAIFGLTRKAAEAARGLASITGAGGIVVPSGTLLVRADGERYVATADAPIGGGGGTLAVAAERPGLGAEMDSFQELTFLSPIVGVQATATVAAPGLTGAAEQESDDLLRARLLLRIRNPIRGGSASDYVVWATDVAEVTRAWAYENWNGLGTVRVLFVADGYEPMSVHDAAAYRAQLQALLPRGAAWSRERDANLTALLEGFAQEFASLDLRADQLLDETDPRTAYELLGDWERLLGLPDPCTAAATSITARQLSAWRKLAYLAGQTPAFYVALAASIGFAIEVHEFDPDVDDYDASLAGRIGGGRYRYVWRVHVLNGGDFSYFRAGDSAGGRLVEGDVSIDVECIIARTKPAHTYVVFSYPEAGLPVSPDAPTVENVGGIAVPYQTATAIDLSSHISGNPHTGVDAGAGDKGSTTVAGDVVTYTPAAGRYGADRFGYTASGAGGTSAIAEVSLTIGNPPAPVAHDLAAISTAYETAVPIDLGGSIDGVYESIAAGAGAHGGTSVSGRFVTYAPAAGFSGNDSFGFTATGPGGASSATVGVTVAAMAPGGGGGGGGGSSGNAASINPGFRYFTGRTGSRSAPYTASSSGSAPRAYSWGVLDGSGSVTAGATSATATLLVFAAPGTTQQATFYCDLTIDGAVQRATCVLQYNNSSPGRQPTLPENE